MFGYYSFLMATRRPPMATWTLECEDCHQRFEIKLNPPEGIIKHVKEEHCPHCHARPTEVWHKIIGYSPVKPD
jgi:hypothetical protein